MSTMILKPVISEKSLDLAANGKYVFEVPKKSNKITVSREVASVFKVTVKDVNMLVQKGKVKRLRNIKGRRIDTKRAVVTLKKGDKISAFDIQEEKK